MNALVTELTAMNSYVLFTTSDHDTTSFAITASKIHESTLKIIVGAFAHNSATSDLSLDGSSMKNTYLKKNLLNSTNHGLSIHNSSITGSEKDSGIKIATFNRARLAVFIEHCKIVDNYQGVSITAFNTSYIDFNVDSCYIADNGDINHLMDAGGISVFYSDKSMISVSITMSTLFTNLNAHLGFMGSGGA